VWKILHQGDRYIEYGNRPNPKTVKERARPMIRELQTLGYQVEIVPPAEPLPS
jgi:hypothetical protein